MKSNWIKWAIPLVLILITTFFFWVAPMQSEPPSIQFEFADSGATT